MCKMILVCYVAFSNKWLQWLFNCRDDLKDSLILENMLKRVIRRHSYIHEWVQEAIKHYKPMDLLPCWANTFYERECKWVKKHINLLEQREICKVCKQKRKSTEFANSTACRQAINAATNSRWKYDIKTRLKDSVSVLSWHTKLFRKSQAGTQQLQDNRSALPQSLTEEILFTTTPMWFAQNDCQNHTTATLQ